MMDLDAICDPAAWRRVAPALTIDGRCDDRRDGGRRAVYAVSNHHSNAQRVRAAETAVADLIEDGFFRTGEVLDYVHRVQARLAVDIARDQGLPPLFAFVYDAPWTAFAQLAPIIAPILGEDFRALPDFWCWYLVPNADARGWLPHRDRPGTVRADGTPNTLTVWLALTDATVDNGCIYVLPKAFDPRYGTSAAPVIGIEDVQNIRALPAAAGTALGWDQQLWHWGARSTRHAQGPRVSIACEFQRADVHPYNVPLLDVCAPPPFEERLRLIGKQLRQYTHIAPLAPEISRLAARLADDGAA